MYLSSEQETILKKIASYDDDGVSKSTVDFWKGAHPRVYNIIQELMNMDLVELDRSDNTFHLSYEAYDYLYPQDEQPDEWKPDTIINEQPKSPLPNLTKIKRPRLGCFFYIFLIIILQTFVRQCNQKDIVIDKLEELFEGDGSMQELEDGLEEKSTSLVIFGQEPSSNILEHFAPTSSNNNPIYW